MRPRLNLSPAPRPRRRRGRRHDRWQPWFPATHQAQAAAHPRRSRRPDRWPRPGGQPARRLSPHVSELSSRL